MVNRSVRLFSAFALTLCAGFGLRAATPVFWTAAGQAELLEGDITNLSIDYLGRLMLGPTLAPVYHSTAPFLWSVVSDAGGALYVGSGNEGRVYAADADGNGRVFFDADELEVHALALGADGNLYVGTSPDGRVYKVANDGTATVFFDPADRYIWALVFDDDGNLYVGTGDRGRIYRVSPNGDSSVFYSTSTTHAVTLAMDASGALLAGTDSPGRLFQINGDGRGFVLLDSPFDEIHSISVHADGAIFVTALDHAADVGVGVDWRPATPQEDPASTPSSSSPGSAMTEVTVVADGSSPAQRSAPAGASSTTRGGVYRVTPDGVWDLIWESSNDLPYDVSFDADGRAIVATGPDGKIYRLGGDSFTPTLLARAAAKQVTAFLRAADGTNYLTTANPGMLMRLSEERANWGTYESRIRDAGTVAAWGIVSWRSTTSSGGRIDIYTRSGNTSSPDSTWSDWEGPYRNTDGEQIRNPTARYLQWKAELSGRDADPVLTSVTAAYLPRNVRPRVESITVHPPGIVFQQPFPTGDPPIAGLPGDPPDRRRLDRAGGNETGSGVTTSAVGRRTYKKGFQTFVWRVRDEDADEQIFTLSYRREGETTWKTLKAGLSDTIYVWDTTSVPDGTYLVKLAASDLPSNAPERALVGELESGLFDIDNTPPVIGVTGLRWGSPPTLLFEVRDAQSVIERVEYSVDAGQWLPLYPVDGMADSRTEAYELPLDGTAAASEVIIRAVDAANNVATARGAP